MYLILILFTPIIYIKKSIKYDSKTSNPADLSVTALITILHMTPKNILELIILDCSI